MTITNHIFRISFVATVIFICGVASANNRPAGQVRIRTNSTSTSTSTTHSPSNAARTKSANKRFESEVLLPASKPNPEVHVSAWRGDQFPIAPSVYRSSTRAYPFYEYRGVAASHTAGIDVRTTHVESATTVAVEGQLRSGALAIKPSLGHDSGGPALRAALRKALRFKKLAVAKVSKTSGLQSDAHQTILVDVPVNEPLRITVGRGRSKAVMNARANGLPSGTRELPVQQVVSEDFAVDLRRPVYPEPETLNWDVRSDASDDVKPENVRVGGEHQRHAQPWVQEKNLFVTPAHRDSNGKEKAIILGLSAFPIGAQVSVTNLTRKAAGQKDHSVSRMASKKTGSSRLEIPVASSSDQMLLTVAYPGRAGESFDSIDRYRFRLPNPSDAAVKKGGLDYYPMDAEQMPLKEQVFKYIKDQGAITIDSDSTEMLSFLASRDLSVVDQSQLLNELVTDGKLIQTSDILGVHYEIASGF